MSTLTLILLVIALILAIVSFFIPPRAVQILAAATILICVALLIPEVQ